MIIVFSRSREANGINEIKRCLSEIQNVFHIEENVFNLFSLLKNNNNNVEGIFCLASTEVLISTCFIQKLSLKIPIVMGVYHPNQWKVMLDSQYSATRSKLFSEILKKISSKNIIYNSASAHNECMKISPIHGKPNLILAPSFPPKISENHEKIKKLNKLSIATVGRFVDFKVSSIFSMIDVVSSLNSKNHNIEYHIYGNGPLEEDVKRKINASAYSNKFFFHGFLNPEKFGDTILEHDIYFGMGFTVVHAAMLSIPSIIAIQNEKKPVTYGYFSRFDHSKMPMFGDFTDDATVLNLEQELLNYIECSATEKLNIGEKCKESTLPYKHENIIKSIIAIVNDAEFTCFPKISFIDIIAMRFETFFSRILKRQQIHT